MIDLNTQHILMLTGAAFLSGIIGAISGSGALLMLPALLLTGMPPQMAMGTNRLFNTINLFVSSIYFIKQRLFEPALWYAIIVATLVGTLIGCSLALLIPTHLLLSVLPVCFIGLTLYFLLPGAWQHDEGATGNTPCKRFYGRLVSTLLGVYSGFVGAGTAPIWTATAIRLFKLPALEAAGVARMMCCLSNLFALLLFIALQRVDFSIGALVIITSLLGTHLGTKLCFTHGVRIIKPCVLASTAIMALKLSVDAWV